VVISKCSPRLHIGFVSTRFEGTDGVSLETEKWAAVLESMEHKCFYYAGLCDRPPAVSRVVPEAWFRHPAIDRINEQAYSLTTRPPSLTRQIYELKDYFKESLTDYIHTFDLDLLVVENALSIPLNIPLGLAITETIAETSIPTIAHHHDMFWERKRFLVNCVWDFLNMAFPPHLPSIHHVVINSSASNQLGLRTGVSSTLVPNVMDFDNPPEADNGYSTTLPADLGLQPGEHLVLQPTRVVQRKGIEHAIELVSSLGIPARLVVSHAAGDEGREYEHRLRDYSVRMHAPIIFVSDIIQQDRSTLPDGRKVYTLADAYHQAALVTYPSDIEGFGNAFLEAIYHSRPIVVNNYSIFSFDIKPKGFQVIEFDGFVTHLTVEKTRQVLLDPELGRKMAETNYAIARRYYSYKVLHDLLCTVLIKLFGE
jgi:mannosylglucosylglycerate synthase